MEKLFYQSSLPRAGSTLLQNILAQNPDIYATPTSGLMELVYGARGNYTDSPEFTAQDKDLMRKGFLAFSKAGMNAYCEALTDKKYFIDKSRSWGIHYDLIKMVRGDEDVRVVCMVRDLRDVFASMEKIFRKNPDKSNPMIDWGTLQNTTIPKRIDHWAKTPPIGLAVDRLKDIIDRKLDSHIMFVRYEDLCLHPEATMSRLYNYFGIPYYSHNFDYIEQSTKEDDNIYGNVGDHIIRSRLSLTPSMANEILTPQVCTWIYNSYAWFFKYFKYDN
jgi:sulfotransferase